MSPSGASFHSLRPNYWKMRDQSVCVAHFDSTFLSPFISLLGGNVYSMSFCRPRWLEATVNYLILLITRFFFFFFSILH